MWRSLASQAANYQSHGMHARERRESVEYSSDASLAEKQIFRKASCACGGGCPSCSAGHAGLQVSQPHDAAEVEADRVANSVMRMPVGSTRSAEGVSGSQHSEDGVIHRKCAGCEEEDEDTKLRRKAKSSADGSDYGARVSGAIGSGGRALDRDVRNFFEPRLGYDLGGVRVHTGAAAQDSARSLDARAYTLGNHVVFGAGEYRPDSESGRHLIAHELAHVGQSSGSANTIHRRTIGEDKIHGPVLDEFSRETGMPREEASQHSPEYRDWLLSKEDGALEFEKFTLTAQHLKLPAIKRRFESMSLEELYNYRQDYMFAELGTKDPAVIKFLTDMMTGRPTQPCTKAEVKQTNDIAKQVMKDAPPMVNKALTAITRLLSLWANEKPDLLAKKSKFSGQVSCAFSSNFNITETDPDFGVTAIRVERRLTQLQKRINKPVTFACEPINSKICLESKGRDAEGFVVNHQEPVHLCYPFRENGIYSFQQSTVIHEILHLLPGLGDDGGYAALSTSAIGCKPGIQFTAKPDVLDNTADAITGFIMHIENTSATDIKVVPF